VSVKILQLNTLYRRIIFLILTAIALAAMYYFAKWNFADQVSTATNIVEMADLTTRMAPGDPQTHYAAAVLYEKTFLPDDLERSMAEYEIATALAPHNFLFWLELGKARERSGDIDGAESALRKALELAPNYSVVQWPLGNVLLRQGKTDEGFAEIRKALAGNPMYAVPAVNAAAQIFDGNTSEIRRAIGDNANVNAALVGWLAGRKQLDEAVKIWNSLPADERKTTLKENGNALFGQLVGAKEYGLAAGVFADDPAQIKRGTMRNGDFESPIKAQGASLFEWQIADGPQPQIVISDGQKHGGSHSLWLVFNSRLASEFRQVSQTVVAEPGRSYIFEAFYKEDLNGSGAMRWEILDAVDGKVLAATDPTANTPEWQRMQVKFMVPQTSDAVIVRLALVNCASEVCPMSGKVWFDDLNLKAM
jgi:Tfp pilus assembly protein PilF